MAARQCPNCLVIVSVTRIGPYSHSLVCAGCEKPLEISAFSRNLAAFIGLAVGALVWRVSTTYYGDHASALGWALPILFAYLALCATQTLVLIAVADLRVRELIEPPAAVEAHSGHGGHAHSQNAHPSH